MDGGGVDTLRSLLTIKRVATTFDFQSNELPLKFMRPPLIKTLYDPGA